MSISDDSFATVNEEEGGEEEEDEESFFPTDDDDDEEEDGDEGDDDDDEDENRPQNNGYQEEEEEEELELGNDRISKLQQQNRERIAIIGFHGTLRELMQQAFALLDDLPLAADDYSAGCRDFYNTTILKTVQDSTRTTLESIVAAKSRQLRQSRVLLLEQSDKEWRDLENIGTAVRVFGDRQDVLARQIGISHTAFKEARERYNQMLAKLGDVSIQLRDLRPEAVRRARTLDENLTTNSTVQDLESVISQANKQRYQSKESMQKQLRSLRGDYFRNQPPLPVTV